MDNEIFTICVIFRVFQASEGKRKAGGECETYVMGKCPEKEYAFHFFPADFPVARVSRSTPASCSPEKLEQIAGQQASFFYMVRAMKIQLFR